MKYEIAYEFMNFILTVMVGIIGWYVKSLSNKIDKLSLHREGCIKEFSSKFENAKEHDQINEKLENHRTDMYKKFSKDDVKLHDHELRLKNLESKVK